MHLLMCALVYLMCKLARCGEIRCRERVGFVMEGSENVVRILIKTQEPGVIWAINSEGLVPV